MPYDVELRHDSPVLLVTVSGGFSLEDFMQVTERVRAILDSQPTSLFHITDFTNSEIPLDEMMVGASEVARSEVSLFSHPNIRENIFITGSEYMARVADGLNTEPFGNVPVSVFSSLADALEYVEQQT